MNDDHVSITLFECRKWLDGCFLSYCYFLNIHKLRFSFAKHFAFDSQNKNFIFIHASDDFNAHLYSISIKIKTIICRIGKCLDMRHHVMSRFIMEKYVSCLRRQIMLYSKSLPNLDVPQDHQRYRYRQAIRVLSRCGPSALCVFFLLCKHDSVGRSLLLTRHLLITNLLHIYHTFKISPYNWEI